MIDVTPLIEKLDGRPMAIFGLRTSNRAILNAFKGKGVTIYAWDDKDQARDELPDDLATLQPLDKDCLEHCAWLVMAPGVPLNHPVVRLAKEAGCETLCDIELFHRLNHGRTVIALTGTNGKSTTASLIHHILKENGTAVELAGNIGRPIFDIDLPKKDGVIVLELSSFQLDLCPEFRADISLLLNITPDHIDRHGSVENYAAIKARIFDGAGTAAIIGIDDHYCQSIYDDLQKNTDRTLIPVSVQKKIENGIYVDGGTLHESISGEDLEIGSLSKITKLHGIHNHQNAAISYAACKMAGLDPDLIMDAIQSYPGLPHRQYPVRIINGVSYINDSKATNAEAASKALACHNNIFWILGGIAKDGGLNGLEPYMDKIRYAFLIGEAAPDFEKWLERYQVETIHSHTLERAVQDAHYKAQQERGQPGGAGCVLLSPACASFDQFQSFEARGDAFTKAVNALTDDGL